MLTESHPACIVGSKQHIGNPNSEANTCTGIYLWSSTVPVLNHNASKNIRLATHWNKDITATSLPGETMMTLFAQILSQRNFIYAHIFVSASSWLQANQFFHFFVMLHDLLSRQDLSNNWFERSLKLSKLPLSIFRKVFHKVSFIFRIPKVTLKWLWKFLVISN